VSARSKPHQDSTDEKRRTVSPARRAALEILLKVEQETAYSSALLAALDPAMRSDDRALCHELVLGVLRRQLWLDRAIEHFADRKIDDLDLPVKLALRLGMYQLRFLSRIPPSAAVNESVDLVRSARISSASGLVNAVLRRATREPDYDPAEGVADGDEKTAIETSHPEWLIRTWANAFGFKEAVALAHANNEPAPIAFRLTRQSLAIEEGAERIVSQLEAAGAKLTPSTIVPNSWRVQGAANVLRELASDGLIYLQDEASQLVAHLLNAQPNERILDVCAAPGSKTTLIATLAPEARIIAGDLHEHRLRTLRELAARQGIKDIQLIVYDATQPLPFAEEAFDRVLVDAPCSGTGTLRSNPEIRWRVTESDVQELSQKQNQILANASAVVKDGGHLVYSTCSLEPEENEKVVERFLLEHEDFGGAVPDVPPEMQTETGAIRTWPHRDNTDGFFIKSFERKN
jgi:16S rRNA (cytosine967-C5)-methyltransferase